MATDTRDLPAVIEPQSTALANMEDASAALSHILGTGDLAQLSNEQRVGHYLDVCASLGLNPRTRPFDWIEFYDPETRGKKLTLYPNRSCAEQLRRQHQISVKVVRREMVGELFVVEVEGTTPTGRTGTASKYVAVTDNQGAKLRGQRLANAYMKAETGAFRRLTFSMVGMASPPDMDELQRPKVVVVDGLGNVLDSPTPEQKALAADPSLAQVIGEPTYEDMAPSQAFEGAPVQTVRPEELERPAPPAKRTSLTCDADHYRAAYFAAVADTPLATDLGRKAFMAAYTSGFSPALRTDSLSAFLKRASDRQAADLVAQAKVEADEIREDMASRQGDEDDDDQAEAF